MEYHVKVTSNIIVLYMYVSLDVLECACNIAGTEADICNSTDGTCYCLNNEYLSKSL